MVNDIAVQDFVNAIKEKPTDTNTTYNATVSHVDSEGIVWVNLYGSTIATPTTSTSSEVKSGDQVTVNWRNNKLYIGGNYSNPSAGVTTVNRVEGVANNAQATADVAFNAANNAVADAERAHAAADEAEGHAQTALTNAGIAQTAAESAQTSADSALVSLATVEDVVGVLNWITAHGTMTANGSTALDPAKVYFIRDNNGDYTVGSYNYSIVAEPKAEDRTSYYTLSVDESVQNYVATHVAVNTEGMWLIPDQNGTPTTNGKKILIATGAGSTYTTAGTYIIDRSSGTDKVLASFRADGVAIGENSTGKSRSEISTSGMQILQNVNGADTAIANLGYGQGINTSGGTSNAPYFTFGIRTSVADIGNYSTVAGYYCRAKKPYSYAEGNNTEADGTGAHAEGGGNIASGAYSHVEGYGSKATYDYSHAEGAGCEANGYYAHAEGYGSIANGTQSHAQNCGTIASSNSQTTLGKYNVEDNANTYAVILGNGTANDARSNALTVDWNGNVNIASGAKYQINGTSLVDLFYPVGSYYETSDTSFDPNTTWGGTWSLETAGQVHVSSGTGYSVAGALTDTSDGGATSVSITANNLPTHTHAMNHTHGDTFKLKVASPNNTGTLSTSQVQYGKPTGTNYENDNALTGEVSQYTGSTGNNTTTHANLSIMQPYIVVNRWHRTA